MFVVQKLYLHIMILYYILIEMILVLKDKFALVKLCCFQRIMRTIYIFLTMHGRLNKRFLWPGRLNKNVIIF